MRMHTSRVTAAAALLLLTAAPAAAQSLSQRVQQAPAGRTVIFTYEARPGVCGDGRNIVNVGDHDVRYVDLDHGRRAIVSDDGTHLTRSGRCDFGPVRIELERTGRTIHDLETTVGAPNAPANAVDLGSVAPAEAVRFLLEDVIRTAANDAAEGAIFATTLAAGVEPWAELLDVARDEQLARGVRKSAVFWVGQAAAARATEGLQSVVNSDTDIEVRESAIFALSQRPHDEGVPILIEIVKTSPEPRLRKSAMFWLGQSNDPRALALFEELLIGG